MEIKRDNHTKRSAERASKSGENQSRPIRFSREKDTMYTAERKKGCDALEAE